MDKGIRAVTLHYIFNNKTVRLPTFVTRQGILDKATVTETGKILRLPWMKSVFFRQKLLVCKTVLLYEQTVSGFNYLLFTQNFQHYQDMMRFKEQCFMSSVQLSTGGDSFLDQTFFFNKKWWMSIKIKVCDYRAMPIS